MKNPGYRAVGGRGAVWNSQSDRPNNIHSATRCATPSIILAPGPRLDAAEICAVLGGRKSGRGWAACCPGHDDRTPSLSIQDADDGRVLVHCHSGCDQARVIAALQSRGLWPKSYGGSIPHPLRRSSIERRLKQDDDKRTDTALAIWHAAEPASGTLVESYLAARGIDLPPPNALRFHGGLKHPLGRTWPAMVALVTSGVHGTPIAIHRTFLTHDGRGKAPVEQQKMMLGLCRGGAVRLAESSEVLMVGEGVETCLAAMRASGQPAWAALSTSGLRSLDLPRDVREVIVLADDDEPGEAAAEDCARRWKHEGRRVRIARPPVGMDFNDMLITARSGRPQIDQATVGDLPWR
jgi:putative DNA primase/helicase